MQAGPHTEGGSRDQGSREPQPSLLFPSQAGLSSGVRVWLTLCDARRREAGPQELWRPGSCASAPVSSLTREKGAGSCPLEGHQELGRLAQATGLRPSCREDGGSLEHPGQRLRAAQGEGAQAFSQRLEGRRSGGLAQRTACAGGAGNIWRQ